MRTPGESAEISATEALLINAAATLSVHGNWIDERRGRELFEQLRETDKDVYAQAFRQALAHPLWRSLLMLAIKIGRPSVLDRMTETLHERGSTQLAEMYLDSGCHPLVQCAYGNPRSECSLRS